MDDNNIGMLMLVLSTFVSQVTSGLAIRTRSLEDTAVEQESDGPEIGEGLVVDGSNDDPFDNKGINQPTFYWKIMVICFCATSILAILALWTYLFVDLCRKSEQTKEAASETCSTCYCDQSIQEEHDLCDNGNIIIQKNPTSNNTSQFAAKLKCINDYKPSTHRPAGGKSQEISSASIGLRSFQMRNKIGASGLVSTENGTSSDSESESSGGFSDALSCSSSSDSESSGTCEMNCSIDLDGDRDAFSMYTTSMTLVEI